MDLDRQIAIRALKGGQSPESVVLMLIANSSCVEHIHASKGKQMALLYAQRTVTDIRQQQNPRKVRYGKRGLEL